MVVQVPFHRWGGEGIPLPVRQQLVEIGGGAACCVVCGHSGHGVHTCHNAQSPEGQALMAAWDKKWLLLLGQELIRYALCPDDTEYRRRSAALSVTSLVDRAAVVAFQREHAIQSTSPGYGGSFGRQPAKKPAASQPAPTPQRSAAPNSTPKPKPKPKQPPKAPAKISVVAAAAPAVPAERAKRQRKRGNRRQRKTQQAASTQAYGLQATEMEVDATASSSFVSEARNKPR